ncbi:hypothetical protein A2U01_0107778, partial [Trifolium medium]|nr:hypothetical protein [Trifolium medium]
MLTKSSMILLNSAVAPPQTCSPPYDRKTSVLSHTVYVPKTWS